MGEKQLRIERMFAFIALDPADNTEGVVALQAGDVWYPAVGADMDMMDQLRPVIEQMARTSRSTITLCVFEFRQEHEVYTPAFNTWTPAHDSPTPGDRNA